MTWTPNLFLLSCSILFLINPYNHDSLMAPTHAKHTVVTICLGIFIKRIRIYFACIVALARWKNLEEPNHTQCQSSLPTAGLYYRDDCCHLLLFILTNRVHRLASHISRQPHRPCRHHCFLNLPHFTLTKTDENKTDHEATKEHLLTAPWTDIQ